MVLSWEKQRKFDVDGGGMGLQKKSTRTLSDAEYATQAASIQALHMVEKNHSFASAKDDGARFRAMFPDCNIAKMYTQADSKLAYVIKFGLAPYFKKELIYDVRNTPFSFLFDETTKSQAKKQYDAYVLYWSKRLNVRIVSQHLLAIAKLTRPGPSL